VSALAQPLAPQHLGPRQRLVRPGQGAALPAALDLIDPALAACLGVLLLALFGAMGA